jgi:hypothetical protein
MRPIFLSLGLGLIAGAPLASAQVVDNASRASQQASTAAGVLAESGVKASAGVVAVPLGAAGVVSGSAGLSAAASGQNGLAGGLSGAAGDASKAASALTDFSNKPLSIEDDVVIAPQPAPQVPAMPTPAAH